MITIYSRPGCGMCEQTKKLLTKFDAEFTEVQTTDDIEKQIVAQGFQGPYPYVVTDSDSWSGFRYEKLKAFKNEGTTAARLRAGNPIPSASDHDGVLGVDGEHLP